MGVWSAEDDSDGQTYLLISYKMEKEGIVFIATRNEKKKKSTPGISQEAMYQAFSSFCTKNFLSGK